MKKNIIKKQKNIGRVRFIVVFLILAILVILFLFGRNYIQPDYFVNIITEIIGIALTVLIIDIVYNYFNNRSEKIHRAISLKYCKTPIFFYSRIWFTIYEPRQLHRMLRLQQYQDLEKFFMSDEFYNTVCDFNFAYKFSSGKTFAQFYAEKLKESEKYFQNMLTKYASKLSLEDIERLEFFGGGSLLTKIFVSMDISMIENTSTQDDTTKKEKEIERLNEFKKVSKENFQKHFRKLLTLIDDYNSVCDTEYQWTIDSLNFPIKLDDVNANIYDW